MSAYLNSFLRHLTKLILASATVLVGFLITAQAQPATEATAIFAGGCFWCMEPPFEKLKGVKKVESGYSGGTKPNPSYKEVSAGGTGHLEVVRVTYDPKQIGFSDLLEVYWRQIDPTDDGGSFVDRGESYKSAVFYQDEEQKRLIEKSRDELAKSRRFKKTIVTQIRPEKEFYLAEEYHQDYYKKNPIRYKFYRYRSGRDQYLDQTWGKAREIKRLIQEK